MRKKLVCFLMVTVWSVMMAGCVNSTTSDNAQGKDEKVKVTVFAAASMTESLEQIAKDYEEKKENVKLTFSFGSSGTLKTQIQEGATCDVFISAAQKQMNELDGSAEKVDNPDGFDLLKEGSRVNLLENKVVLCVSKENKADIHSFDDLIKALKTKKVLLAMGNRDVPVGQYTQKILEYYQLDEEVLAKEQKITYGDDVKVVTKQVLESAVDCGIVYATDAASAGLEPVDYATVELCGEVTYPAAVLKDSNVSEEAQKFLDYLGTKEARDVFTGVGFTVIK